MKLSCVIHIKKSMFPINKRINSFNILYTGSYKVFRCIAAYSEKKKIKYILKYLCRTKCNVIKTYHSNAEKRVSYTG